MAPTIHLPPLPGSEIRGRVGSLIYSRNQYQPFAYDYPSKIDPGSALQLSLRSIMTNALTYWRVMWQSERDEWKNYAANVSHNNNLGKSITPTGQNRFVGVSILREYLGQSPPFDAPLIFSQGRCGQPQFAPRLQNRVIVNFDLGDTWRHSYNAFFTMQQSPPQSVNVNRYHGPYRTFAGVTGNPFNPPTFRVWLMTMPPTWQKPRTFFRARIIESDNRLSPPVFGHVTNVVPPPP